MSVSLQPTSRFSVLSPLQHSAPKGQGNVPILPSFALNEIFLCHNALLYQGCEREIVKSLAKDLHRALCEHGAFLITCPTESKPGQILTNLWSHIKGEQLFPTHAERMTSNMIYVSERDVPMYRLGYERTEDQIREIVRLAGGLDPDEVKFVSREQRTLFLQSMALLRHLTDAVLDLVLKHCENMTGTLGDNGMSNQSTPPGVVRRRKRPYSYASSWSPKSTANGTTKHQAAYFELPPGSIRDRSGDFSVFYAMHYFNETALPPSDEKSPTLQQPDDTTPIAVKAHVDPSLCVVEPFIWPFSRGLQLWHKGKWLECDGPNSPLLPDEPNQCQLLLFAGKALQMAAGLPSATVHRVVQGHCPRKTVIYEQKYAEFFD